MTDRIEGKVAQILNRRELVINVGEDDGVRAGMKFAVLNPKGVNVTDPDTGESLGSVELPKVLVEAVRVSPRLSVARTFRTTVRNIGGTGWIDIFRPAKTVEEPETLQLSDKPYEEELSEEDSYVKIGDPVIQALAKEFEPE